jgi:phenylalanyl-tRNA synthetase beta chain
VLSVEPHPNADRLRVCGVDVGSGKLAIVCGAANVAEGLKVPAALVGAKLPNNLKIKKSKLRGVESFGMLCSAVELGLAESAEGLMVLPPDAKIGTDIRDYLKLDDVSIEIGLTPNRGDCLSIQGVAREVGVISQEVVVEPEVGNVVIKQQDAFPVGLSAPKACPRYIGRIIKGVNPKAETPHWMKERLRRCDVRSISPIVDVTNYVMLELGQPMHAFDLAKLDSEIKVRYAEQGEQITLLDGQEVELNSDTLVIADKSRPIAMAGIMGGEETAVSDETVNIFLESAFFVPDAIVGRARQYGLHTDSSHRFERGVDFELPAKAMKRATALLLSIVGGKAGTLIEASSVEHLPAREDISLREERIKKVLGIELPKSEITDMLTSLGMKVREQGKQWVVTPPSFRFDLSIEADLIEEVARIHGYDELPTELPRISLQGNLPRETQLKGTRIRELLVDRGYHRGYQEAITYSFVDEKLQKMIVPEGEAIALANPISNDMSVMRTSLWPGLLQTLKYNQNRQQGRVKIFERGIKYLLQDNEIKEKIIISGLIAGADIPEQWSEKSRNVDFYDIKADVETLLGLTSLATDYMFVAEGNSALHPGQSAAIKTNSGLPIGWIGKLHPSIEKQLDVNGPIFLFELLDCVLTKSYKPEFVEISKFPSIRRDLAIVVDKDISAQQIQGCVVGISGRYLANLQLFDVYCGEGVESGRKSLALGLTFQDDSRTLKDQEIDDLVSNVLQQLNQDFNATLRE